MVYRITRSSTIAHAKKGEERENHKYIKREWDSTKKVWRYWYKDEEYFKVNDKKAVTSSEKVDIKPLNALSSVRATVTKLLEKPLSKTTLDEKISEKVDNFINKFVTTVKKQYDEPIGPERQAIAEVPTATGETKKFYDQEEYDEYLEKYNEQQEYYKQYQDNEPEFMKDVKEIDYYADPKTNLEVVNKPYPTDGYTKNCAYCTAAYELRCRGYDVEASAEPEVTGATDNTSDKILGWYEDAECHYLNRSEYGFVDTLLIGFGIKDIEPNKFTASELKSALEEFPPNSRGNINVSWDSGGGHSMIWETDANGKVTIKDGQANYQAVSLEYLAENSYNVTYFRTDNLTLNESIMEVFKQR